jgi:predicted glycosyl hydrolase (DUF1957 family)
MKWINFLHLYQPPTQSKEIFDRITKESYELIVALLSEYPKLKLTINLSGSLLELLKKYKHEELISRFAEFVKTGRVELVGSAMYHPILPLISPIEIRKQIELHNEISKKWFGDSYKPKGFYFPEMAYSPESAEVVKSMGFEWIILDEISIVREKIKLDIRYEIEKVGLHVIFRNNFVSKKFPPEYVVENFAEINSEYLITAHDAELYGHWHKEDRGYYKKAFTHEKIDFITASEYIASLKQTKTIALRNSNWESTREELLKHIPYALWDDPGNLIHEQLWKLANLATKTIDDNRGDPYFGTAENCLHRGLASCTWWWASERKLGPFSPVCWNPKEIEKGAGELVEAVRTLKEADADVRIKAEYLFSDLHDTIWKTHWKRHNSKTTKT